MAQPKKPLKIFRSPLTDRYYATRSYRHDGYVILFRNTRNGCVGFVGDGDGEEDKLAIFDSLAEAEEAAERVPICRVYPYQIIELEV